MVLTFKNKDMKNKIGIISVLAMMFITLNVNAMSPLRGESHTEFGNYNIRISDEPLIIDGEKLLTYDLEYTNLNKVVKIGIDEMRRCKKFIVKHPGFEIQYDCTKKGFGVRLMEPRYAKLQPRVINTIMDNNQFNYQQIIVAEERPVEDLLHLIACYFPHLICKDIRSSMDS